MFSILTSSFVDCRSVCAHTVEAMILRNPARSQNQNCAGQFPTQAKIPTNPATSENQNCAGQFVPRRCRSVSVRFFFFSVCVCVFFRFRYTDELSYCTLQRRAPSAIQTYNEGRRPSAY